MKRRVLVTRLLTAGLLGGCVYYNGMYNANRLAESARKAEREGRTFEANNLWGQVATKAESVVVRHPTSKYAEEAAVLRGVALARLGQCDQAMGSLSRMTMLAAGSDLTEDAVLATGRCQLAQGNLAAADAAFSQLLQSKSRERRREAHLQHAGILRRAGHYQDALSALGDYREPAANTERILALAGAGRVPEALALADSLMTKGDTTRRWDSVVVALGRQDPSAASSLVERMRRLPNRSSETRARWLLEDGLRMLGTDSSRAAKRFRNAVAAGGSGNAAGQASLALVRLELTRVSQPEDLPAVMGTLKGLAERFETVSHEVTRLGATVGSVHTATTSVTPETPQGDLRLFLAAESARDSLSAPRLAESIFRRIVDQWPTSLYAPKAILAAQQLNSGWIDSARVLLEERYLDSPYLAMVRGDATPAYQQLEDSLGAFAASLWAASRPVEAPRRAPPPADAAEPGRRPQPRPGGSRVPEPQ
jgi:tetratricopeptide (TPR) repeat protein